VAWNSAETDKRIPNIIQLMKKNVLQKSNESGKCQVQVQQVNDSRKYEFWSLHIKAKFMLDALFVPVTTMGS
jgi:hypothetical protein